MKDKEQVEYEGQELNVEQDTKELLTVCTEMVTLWKHCLNVLRALNVLI